MKITDYLKLNVTELTDSPPDITKISDNFPKIDANAKSIGEQINNLAAYAVASGTNAYTATIAGITALTEGFSIKIKFTNANTGASTLNINGLGAKSILKGNGNALSSGNIKAGQICNLAYNGSNFQLLGEGGEYGTATASDVLLGKSIGTDNGLVSGTIPSKAAATITPSTVAQTIAAGQYLEGVQTIAGDADLISANIKAGTNIFNVAGKSSVVDTADATVPSDAYMYSGVSAYKNGTKLTGTMPLKGALGVIPNAGNQSFTYGYYDGVTVYGVSNLSEENIKNGVNVGGVVGTLDPAPEYVTIQISRAGSETANENVDFVALSPANSIKTIKCYKGLNGQYATIGIKLKGNQFYFDLAVYKLNGVASTRDDVGVAQGTYSTFFYGTFRPLSTLPSGSVIGLTF